MTLTVPMGFDKARSIVEAFKEKQLDDIIESCGILIEPNLGSGKDEVKMNLTLMDPRYEDLIMAIMDETEIQEAEAIDEVDIDFAIQLCQHDQEPVWITDMEEVFNQSLFYRALVEESWVGSMESPEIWESWSEVEVKSNLLYDSILSDLRTINLRFDSEYDRSELSLRCVSRKTGVYSLKTNGSYEKKIEASVVELMKCLIGNAMNDFNVNNYWCSPSLTESLLNIEGIDDVLSRLKAKRSRLSFKTGSNKLSCTVLKQEENRNFIKTIYCMDITDDGAFHMTIATNHNEGRMKTQSIRVPNILLPAMYTMLF